MFGAQYLPLLNFLTGLGGMIQVKETILKEYGNKGIAITFKVKTIYLFWFIPIYRKREALRYS